MSISKFNRALCEGGMSGLTWGLGTVILAIVITLPPFSVYKLTALGGVFVIGMIHEVFSTLYLGTSLLACRRLKGFGKALASREGMLCVLAGVCGGPLAMTSYIYAITHAGTSVATTITAAYPIIGAVAAYLILREKMTRQLWLGLLLVVFGIFYLNIAPQNGTADNMPTGVALALVSAVCWGMEAVVIGYAMKTLLPSIALLIREISAAIAYIIGFCYLAYNPLDIVLLFTGSDAHWQAWLLLVGASFLTLWSMYMWYSSIRVLGAPRGICLNVTYCFWALLFGALLLGQELSWKLLGGAAMIVFGVYLSCVSKGSKSIHHESETAESEVVNQE